MSKNQIGITSTQTVKQNETQERIVTTVPKLSFVQKIALKIYKKKFISILERPEKQADQLIGFFLGFLFGLIGVAIAYACGKGFAKGAWEGFIIFMVIFLALLI